MARKGLRTTVLDLPRSAGGGGGRSRAPFRIRNQPFIGRGLQAAAQGGLNAFATVRNLQIQQQQSKQMAELRRLQIEAARQKQMPLSLQKAALGFNFAKRLLTSDAAPDELKKSGINFFNKRLEEAANDIQNEGDVQNAAQAVEALSSGEGIHPGLAAKRKEVRESPGGGFSFDNLNPREEKFVQDLLARFVSGEAVAKRTAAQTQIAESKALSAEVLESIRNSFRGSQADKDRQFKEWQTRFNADAKAQRDAAKKDKKKDKPKNQSIPISGVLTAPGLDLQLPDTRSFGGFFSSQEDEFRAQFRKWKNDPKNRQAVRNHVNKLFPNLSEKDRQQISDTIFGTLRVDLDSGEIVPDPALIDSRGGVNVLIGGDQ